MALGMIGPRHLSVQAGHLGIGTMNRTQNPVISRPLARGLFVLTMAVASLLLSTGRADAQWGYEGFWGLNPNDGSQITEGINQRAMIAGQAAFAARQNIMPSTSGGNSYRNFIRDDSFVDRVGISTRRGVQSAGVVPPAPPRATATPAPRNTTPAPAPAKPIVALAGFFNRANVLVWPADSPVTGDLFTKRVASDKASLLVYDEFNSRGLASVSSVTEARSLLLDYGRPALQYLRDNSTQQVSDSFHLFLLSLYEALAQAGNPPAR